MRGNMVSTLEQGTGGMVIPVCLDSFWFCFSCWQFFQVSLNQTQQIQPKQSSVVPSRTLQLQPIQHHTDLALVRLGDQDEAPVRLGNQTAYGPVRQKWSINSFSLSFCVANLFPSGTIWLRKICWTKSRLEFQDVHSCGPHVKPAKYKPIACYGFPCEGNIGARLGCNDLPVTSIDFGRFYLWIYHPFIFVSMYASIHTSFYASVHLSTCV